LGRILGRAGAATAFAASALLLATPASRLDDAAGSRWLALLVLSPPLLALAARRAASRGTPWSAPERLALLLAALPLVAGSIQLAALARLDAAAPVAASGMTATAAGEAVVQGIVLHAVLPASFLSFLLLFRSSAGGAERWLSALPFALVPSAVVAIYQARVDLEPWNVDHFLRHGRASGLAYDANSLAATLFLLLPLVMLAVTHGAPWRRVAAGGGLLVFGAALPATGNRAALAAVAIGLVFAPWLARRLFAPASRGVRRALAIAPLLLAAAIYLAVDSAAGQASARASGLDRLAATLDDLRAQGVAAELRASGRAELWRRAIGIWRQAPIAGVGPGGFARELDNERARADLPGLPAIPDLATSHYLQIAAELGAIGLALHLALLMIPVAAVVRWRNPARAASAGREVAAATLVGALPLLQFNHYLLFPDFAWLLGLLLAAVAAKPAGESPARARFAPRAAFVCLAIFALGSALAAFGPHGYRARTDAEWWPFRYDVGCYPEESWEGVATRWCAPDSWLPIPVAAPGDRAVALALLAMHPDLERQPLAVDLRTAAGWRSRLVFEGSRWLQVEIPVTAEALRPCPPAEGRSRSCLAVRLHAARGWRPSEWSATTDDRWLGVAVRARAVPDLELLPGHLFDDGFEAGDLGRWTIGDEDDPEGSDTAHSPPGG
jgi:O-antigen ligase